MASCESRHTCSVMGLSFVKLERRIDVCAGQNRFERRLSGDFRRLAGVLEPLFGLAEVAAAIQQAADIGV
jgi:hypothetical protein